MIENGILITNRSVFETRCKIDEEQFTPYEITASHSPKILDKLMSISDDLILPKNCRYLRKNMNGTITTIIEEAPMMRTIKVRSSLLNLEMKFLSETGKLKEYGIDKWLEENERVVDIGHSLTEKVYYLNLSFPYVIFVLNFILNDHGYAKNFMKVFFRLSPLSSLTDNLIIPNLTNIYTPDLNICYPTPQPASSLSEAVSDNISLFWASIFNEDLTSIKQRYLTECGTDMSTFLTWQVLSKNDPMAIFSENWIYDERNLEKELVLQSHESSTNSRNIVDFMYKKMYDNSKDKVSYKKYEAVLKYDGRTIFLTNGDEIEYEGENYFVECFNYDRNTGYLTSIELFKISDESVLELVLNTSTIFKIIDQNSQKSIKEVEIDGKKIKVGEYITYHNEIGLRRYKGLITSIRKNRLGYFEFKIGSSSNYILLTKDLVESIVFLFDLNAKDKKWIVEYYRDSATGCESFAEIVFEEEINKKSDIVKLKRLSDNYTQSSYLSDVILFDPEVYRRDFITYPCFEKNGFLYINFEGSKYKHYVKNEKVYSEVITESINQRTQVEQMLNILIKDDTSINIKSLNGIDIDFKIGDDVAVYRCTSNIVNVGKIVSFDKIIETTSKVNVNVEIIGPDNLPFVHKVEIVNFSDYISFTESGKLKNTFTNKIVKVISEYDKIKAGDKIVCNYKQLYGFPKSHVNVVLGIIPSTPKPMILCSNGQTIYYDEHFFKIFKVYKSNDKKYEAKKINYKIPVYKPKVGDCVSFNGNRSPYVVTSIQETTCRIDYYGSSGSGRTTYFKHLSEIGILTPRFENSEVVQADVEIEENPIETTVNNLNEVVPVEMTEEPRVETTEEDLVEDFDEDANW